MPLSEFASGSRVIKPDAIRFDFAFQRIGTVCREVVDGHACIGVMWDGAGSIFQYPGEYLFTESAEPISGIPASSSPNTAADG